VEGSASRGERRGSDLGEGRSERDLDAPRMRGELEASHKAENGKWGSALRSERIFGAEGGEKNVRRVER